MTPTREQLAVELLKRIYDWNMLDSAADGSFWRREIAQVVAPIQPPTEGDLKWAAAACLAAPPPEPQAMPPIEAGDRGAGARVAAEATGQACADAAAAYAELDIAEAKLLAYPLPAAPPVPDTCRQCGDVTEQGRQYCTACAILPPFPPRSAVTAGSPPVSPWSRTRGRVQFGVDATPKRCYAPHAV